MLALYDENRSTIIRHFPRVFFLGITPVGLQWIPGASVSLFDSAVTQNLSILIQLIDCFKSYFSYYTAALTAVTWNQL